MQSPPVKSFQIGNQKHDNTQQWSISTCIIDSPYAINIYVVPKYSGRNTGYTECKAKEQPRHKTKFIWQQLLSVQQYRRECG